MLPADVRAGAPRPAIKTTSCVAVACGDAKGTTPSGAGRKLLGGGVLENAAADSRWQRLGGPRSCLLRSVEADSCRARRRYLLGCLLAPRIRKGILRHRLVEVESEEYSLRDRCRRDLWKGNLQVGGILAG